MGEGGQHPTSSDPGTWAAGQGPHHLPGNPSDGHFTPGGSHSLSSGHTARSHLAGSCGGSRGGDRSPAGGGGMRPAEGGSYRSRWGSGSEMTTVRIALSVDQTTHPTRTKPRERSAPVPVSQGQRGCSGLPTLTAGEEGAGSPLGPAPTWPSKAGPVLLPVSWTGCRLLGVARSLSYTMRRVFVPSSWRRKPRLHNAGDLPKFTQQQGARARAPAPRPGPQRLQTQCSLPTPPRLPHGPLSRFGPETQAPRRAEFGRGCRRGKELGLSKEDLPRELRKLPL